jgi:hypothetical protein
MLSSYISDVIIWDTYLSDTTFIDKMYNGNEFGYKVVVLAGQSNCLSQGRGIYDSTVDDINLYPMLKNRVFQFPMTNLNSTTYNVINNSIIQASHPLVAWNPQSNTMNGFIQFCDRITTVLKPREKILLIPCGKGGTGFADGNWMPAGPLYTAMCNATNYVLNMSSLNKLIAFSFLEGENESNSLYGNYLLNFYNNLLADMNQFSSVPFIMGEINGSSSGKIDLNKVLKGFANNTNRFLVSCSGLPTNDSDTTHYNASSQRKIGYLFGDCFGDSFGGAVAVAAAGAGGGWRACARPVIPDPLRRLPPRGPVAASHRRSNAGRC